jgi:uncharacterized protein
MVSKSSLTDDMRAAMKRGDAESLQTIRLLLAAIGTREIEKRSGDGGELTEEEVVGILRAESKKRKESIRMYEGAGRDDLAVPERKELELIENYLPKQLDRKAVQDVVVRVLESVPQKEFGSVMKRVMQELKGKADGAVISEVVKELLG